MKLVSLFILLFIPSLTFAKARVICQDASVRQSFDHIVFQKAAKYKVHPSLVLAVIKQESCFDRFAESHAGAQGLMQLIPGTAKRFGVKNVFLAEQNIDGGTQYLAWLLKRFNGNVRYALAAYNAGEGNVDKYKGIPPYKETRRYVKNVYRYYQEYMGFRSRPTPTTLAKKSVSKPFQNRFKIARQKQRKANQLAKIKKATFLRKKKVFLQQLALIKKKKSLALQRKNTIKKKQHDNPPKWVRSTSITLAMNSQVFDDDEYVLVRARGYR